MMSCTGVWPYRCFLKLSSLLVTGSTQFCKVTPQIDGLFSVFFLWLDSHFR